MELFAKRMTWELDNDEGLSCLFFELEDGYFTLSRKTGAEALRLEMNDPANGQLIDPDCFEYALDNTRFRLNIVRNNRKVLRYLEEHHINTELYGEIVLHYTPLSKPQLETLSAVFHAEVDHAFMPGKGGQQFIRHRIPFHMEAHQGVTGQPLHDLCGQLRNIKFLFSI
jgi:hypothetical protein